MKNSTKIGMAIIAAASILGAAYVYAFTGVVEEKAIMAGRGCCFCRRRTAGAEEGEYGMSTLFARARPAALLAGYDAL